MTTEILIVFCVIIVTAAFFVWGKIRSDIVALCSLLTLMLFGYFAPEGCEILSVEEALSGFSSSIVVMMVCLFIVGGAIFQTGLAKKISTYLLTLAGNSQLKLFLLVMLVTGFIGAFVSNTGTVALLLPIVISMANGANADPKRFLMPLAFAGSMGGMLTLIGTPPNLIISDTLEANGYEPLRFFSFLPTGLIVLTLGIICLWPMSGRLLSKDMGERKRKKNKKKEKTLTQLADEYKISNNLYRAIVRENSPLVNKKLRELNLTKNYNVSVVEIKRHHHRKSFPLPIPVPAAADEEMVGPESVLCRNDTLYLLGGFENIRQLAEENLLELLDAHHPEGESSNLSIEKDLNFRKVGMSELVLMSSSKLINKPVGQSGFRTLYNINVLGIKRRDKYIIRNVKDVKMQSGDVLLIQGEWEDIAKLENEDSEWVLVGQSLEKAAKIPIDNKAFVAAIIMISMILCMIFNLLPMVATILTASILMILTGCFRNVESAYKTINWESIFLFAGMIPLSKAMENTGASVFLSELIVNFAGSQGPLTVLATIYIATSLLTIFISNTATAILFAPIAMNAALALHISPYPFLFAVTVAASMCFASPFSTPPNALVMSAGEYTFADYMKVGLPLQIVFAIVMILVLPLLFPF
jgi:di/tricarboxylate transporter